METGPDWDKVQSVVVFGFFTIKTKNIRKQARHLIESPYRSLKRYHE